MYKKFTTRTLVFTGLMIALSVILRLLGFPQSGTYRIEFGFLPIAVSAYMFGPFISGISYVIADVIGTLFTGFSPFLPITLCKFLIGILYGLFFYKKNIDLKRIVYVSLTILFLVDLIFMPLALIPISGDKGFFAILFTRILASFINLPVRIISLYIMSKYLNKFFSGGRNN